MSTKRNCPEKDVLPAAFLNGAKQYCDAADILLSAARETVTSLDPVYMLYFHAAELALKAFLAFRGEKTKVLKTGFRHDLGKLYNQALVRGLAPEATHSQDIQNVISLLDSANLNEALRYFTWRSRAMPEITWAGEVVNQLIRLVENRIGYPLGESGPAVKGDLTIGRPIPK